VRTHSRVVIAFFGGACQQFFEKTIYTFWVLGILKQVLEKCTAGSSVREICEFGDQLIVEETSKVFKKEKELKKGIAFPTCVSVNNCICHFSPIASEPDCILKDGDMVKV
jgi:methionine aminopeptidase